MPERIGYGFSFFIGVIVEINREFIFGIEVGNIAIRGPEFLPHLVLFTIAPKTPAIDVLYRLNIDSGGSTGNPFWPITNGNRRDSFQLRIVHIIGFPETLITNNSTLVRSLS
jgi:hypothetical protein